MKLFTKQQIESALKSRHLYEALGYPSNADFETVLRAGGIGGCTLTADHAKVAYKIWGNSVPRLKGSTVRESGRRKLQSLVEVPRELIQLQQKVCIAGIDIFFVNGHIFFMTHSRMLCFTTVTHLISHNIQILKLLGARHSCGQSFHMQYIVFHPIVSSQVLLLFMLFAVMMVFYVDFFCHGLCKNLLRMCFLLHWSQYIDQCILHCPPMSHLT